MLFGSNSALLRALGHVALSGTMALHVLPWRFFDFRAVQLLQDCESGQILCVHGSVFPALYADGPFRCVDYEGRPLLLQEDGNDDEERSFHSADENFDWAVTKAVAPEVGETMDRYTHKDGRVLWGSDICCHHSGFVLTLPVQDHPDFKSEYFWYDVSSLCGDMPVTLWVNLCYVLDYLGFGGGRDDDKVGGSNSPSRLRSVRVRQLALGAFAESEAHGSPSKGLGCDGGRGNGK